MFPEDCVIEIARVLLENGEKPTTTKLKMVMGKNYKGFDSLPDPVVFKVKVFEVKQKICVSTFSKNYRIQVNWGDGNIENFSKIKETEETDEIYHVYNPGVYKIRIFDLGGFCHVELPVQTIEVLSIGKITSCKNLLRGCESFNAPLMLDTSAVTDMSEMFSSCKNFNQSLHFNTLAVTDMSYMFLRCASFNQPLEIDTSAVTNMNCMFWCCEAFNQPLKIDILAATDTGDMFSGCYALEQGKVVLFHN